MPVIGVFLTASFGPSAGGVGVGGVTAGFGQSASQLSEFSLPSQMPSPHVIGATFNVCVSTFP